MIVMHYPPGARGDFLGGLLLDTIQETNNFAVASPPPGKYTKIHHCEHWDWLDKSDTIKIRIDSNNNSENLIRIAMQHLLKNTRTQLVYLEDEIDHVYVYIKDILAKDRECVLHKHKYDYWIDFSYLSDLDFLYDLYVQINHTMPDDKLFKNAVDNVAKQKTELSPDHKKLAELLDFEIKLNLLNKYRSFTHTDFIASSNAGKFLKLKNYSDISFN
jgi:hypothetical protein